MKVGKITDLPGNKSGHQHPERVIGQGLTFDDVLLVPQRSEVLPREVKMNTRLTRKIDLNIPLVSAAMDTVTDANLAIAIAREGGIGIIHKNLSIKDQVEQVSRVKRSESFTINHPVTLTPDVTLGYALQMMQKYGISGIPVVQDKKLIGMLTNRDIRFATDRSIPVSEYMTKGPLVTTNDGTTLEQAQEILHERRIEKLPVVDENGELLGLITAKDLKNKQMYPNACKDEKGRLRVGAAVGTSMETLDRVDALIQSGVDLVTVDTAHGHSVGVLKIVEKIKSKYPDIQLIAGNIATAAGARDLVSAGVDAVKVGIGAGAICTTRIIAGIGVPQLTAVLNCARELENTDVPLISDGGIRYSGDIAKAIAAGASCVMIGSLFAGADESPGETVLWEGRTYKTYYGMGSLQAMKKGSADRYFQEGAEPDKLVPEGIEGRIPYKGKLSDTIFQLLGGLRAAMGYCGCPDIPTFQRDPEFLQISPAGVRESHPHDITITREAPNYAVKI